MESPSSVASGRVLISLQFPKEYPYVLLLTVVLCLECLILGMIVPGRARGKVYGRTDIQDKIAELHESETGKPGRIVKNGFPDHGNGRFSTDKMISYAQWFDLNRTQRCHQNFLEQLTPVCVLLLVSGMQLPVISSVIAVFYGISRLLYGMQNRVIGFVAGNICIVALILGALYASGYIIS